MSRRRESLGRNRRSPATRSTIGPFIVGATLLAAAGGWGYWYFTQPQRVFGATQLDCAATEITWEQTAPTAYVIRGCDREVFAVCSEESCRVFSTHGSSMSDIEF